ncbi:hypothetical protein [Nocardia acididurans]|nr:hypothetical protein [Nocardia acididurans]
MITSRAAPTTVSAAARAAVRPMDPARSSSTRPDSSSRLVMRVTR